MRTLRRVSVMTTTSSLRFNRDSCAAVSLVATSLMAFKLASTAANSSSIYLCVCVCVCVRRESVCVCVCVCEERESVCV